MSTISASTTTTTAYVVTADTTGALVLQTGATPTTALTLSSAQKMTLPNDASISGLTVGKGGGALTTNTALGAGSLALNSSGAYNTAVGAQAGSSLSSGATSTFVGQGAGQSSTTSSDNTALGAAALNSNTTGASNTAIGRQALQLNTTASNNTAVGYQAGYNYNGSYNTAQGFQAMYGSGTVANNTGSNNTGIGNSALFSLSTGSDNQAFGTTALYLNTTGSSNTAVGRDALRSNTTASNNTAVGYQAGYTNATNTDNTLLGYRAGYTLNSGGNLAVGSDSLSSCTSGNLNTIVGYSAGNAITTGSKNTILGRYTGNQGGLDIRTASNYIVLSDGAGNPRLVITSGGDLRVPQVYNTTSGSAANLFIDSGGNFYRSTSSLKYKKNIEDATHGLAEVLQLRPVTYKGKGENDGETIFGGLIAEEVHAVGLTEFVQYAEDGSPDALAYGNMVSLCVKAIQELKTIVDAQATEIAELKAKVG